MIVRSRGLPAFDTPWSRLIVPLSAVSTNGTDLRLRIKEGWGFVVVTKERR